MTKFKPRPVKHTSNPQKHVTKDSAYLTRMKKQMETNANNDSEYRNKGISNFQKKLMRKSMGVVHHHRVSKLLNHDQSS